jgi:Tol biopolymer transport system component
MKSTAIVFAGMALVLAFVLAGAGQQSAEQLYKTGLYEEEVGGNLQKAIEIYQDTLKRFPDNRGIAAKAQLHIGLCYDKLGASEAEKAFQKVLDNYPEQSDAVREAKEKLSILLRSRALIKTGDAGLKLRQIWAKPDVDFVGDVSPDGRYLSFVDWKTGDLAIREIATETNRRLTNKGSWEHSPAFALFSKWAPDSRRIAYLWHDKDGFELRVIDVKEPTPRILFKVGNKAEDYLQPFDWSPDGKSVLACLFTGQALNQLSLFSVDDGAVKILKTQFENHPAAPKFWGFAFSPDGKYIAYDISQEEKIYEKKDIFLLSADGKTETPLIEHPAVDTVIDWTPDGKGLLFLSDRTGTQDVWLIRVAEGKSQGEPQRLKSGVGRIEPLGVTLDGALYYALTGRASDVYEVGMNPRTGKILSPVKRTVWPYEGHNSYPQYSPDGKLLAYLTSPGMPTVRPQRILGLLTLETGQVRELNPNLLAFDSPRWAPDGRTISVVGIDPETQVWGIYGVDVQSAAVAPIAQFKKGTMILSHRWSRDGGTIYYTLADENESAYSVFVHNLETGQDERLAGAPEAADINISPDGKWLVLTNRKGKRAIRIMPAAGGESREIYSFEQENYQNMAASWSADGRYIYFLKRPKLFEPMTHLYRISVEGGEVLKTDLSMGLLSQISVHPDGQRIAFASLGTNPEQSQVWVMENFLPTDKAKK